MGGGGSTTQTTVQELSPEQRRLLEPVIPVAEEFVRNPPQQFPGTAIAGLTPLQQQAQQMTLQAAQGMLPITQQLPQQLQGINQGFANVTNQVGPTVQQQSNQTLGNLYGNFGNIQGGAQQTAAGVGGALAAGQAANQPGLNFLTSGQVFGANPYLQAATEAAIRPYIQNFQQQVLPSIASQGVASGGFGGTRQGIAEGLAGQELARQAGDITTNMANQGYAQGLNAFQQGLGLQQQQTGQQVQGILGAGGLQNQAAQQVMQGILGGGQLQQAGTLGAAGTQLQGLGGMMSGLGQTGNILGQGLLPAQLVAGVGEQQQGAQQAYLSEQVQRYLNEQLIPFSVAQDVAAMAFGVPAGTTRTTTSGGGGGMGGMQAIQGGLGILGMLLGLSDRRRKIEVRKVGKLPDGLNVYKYRLIGDVIERVGLMSDEVRKIYPVAVVSGDDGYDRVNYGAIPTWNRQAMRV